LLSSSFIKVDIQLPGGEEVASKALRKAVRRDPELLEEAEEYPTLEKIFDKIRESKQHKTADAIKEQEQEEQM
jgi:hypothetical protein